MSEYVAHVGGLLYGWMLIVVVDGCFQFHPLDVNGTHFLEIGRKKGLTVLFADPVYSSDNASGNAFGAFMRYSHEKGNSQ